MFGKRFLPFRKNAFLKKAFIWQHVKIIKLTITIRSQISRDEKGQEFAENLLQVAESTYLTDEISGQFVLINELGNIVETSEQFIRISSIIIQNGYAGVLFKL